MTLGPILQAIWDSLPEDRKKRIEEEADRKIKEYRKLQNDNGVGTLSELLCLRRLFVLECRR